MKAFVISLASSPRRERILQMLRAVPVDVVLLDAVDASRYTGAEPIIGRSALQRMEERYKRTISAGEVCCTLGHVDAMRRMLNDDQCEAALILEDDADILGGLPTLDDIVRAPGDLLIAGYSKVARSALPVLDLKNPFVAVKHVGQWAIAERFHKQTPGSVAYFIKRRAADRVLSEISDRRPYWLADDWNFYASLGIDVKHIQPPVFLESDGGTSYIEASRQQQGFARHPERTHLRPLRVVLAFVRRSLVRARLLRGRVARRFARS